MSCCIRRMWRGIWVRQSRLCRPCYPIVASDLVMQGWTRQKAMHKISGVALDLSVSGQRHAGRAPDATSESSC